MGRLESLPKNRRDLQAYLERLEMGIRRTEERLAEYEARFGRRASTLGDDDTRPDIGEWSGEREMLQRLKEQRKQVQELLKKL